MRTHRKAEPSGWVILAGTLLLLGAGFDMIFGLTALLNEHVLVVSGSGAVSIWNVTTWGWITLITGAALAAVAFALFFMQSWARWAAIVIAGLSAIGQISIITVSPWWSITVIALDVLIIFQLAARWQPAP